MVLRSYQKEASDIAIKFFEESSMKKALQVLSTGAGKSLIVGDIANRLKDKVLCIQSSKELLQQNYNKFISYGQEASIYSASFGKKEHGNVTFATIGSIVKKGEEFRKQGYKYILLDEAHTFKAGNGMWGNFLKTSKIQKVLGLTATPFKMETLGGQFDSYSRLKMITNRGLHYPMFEDIIYLQQIQEIIDLGFWSKIEYEVFDIDSGDLVFNSTGADFTEESINKFYKAQGLEKKIINRIMDSEGQAILVFVPSIQDAQSLAAKVPNSACVYSGMPDKERDRIIDEYRSGKIRTVFNVSILCLDEKTEILTKDGWKDIKSYNFDNDLVANWDINTEEIFFKKAKNYVIRDVKENENFVSCKSRQCDFRVTENHDMVFLSTKNKYWKKSKAIEAVNKIKIIPVAGNLKTVEKINFIEKIDKCKSSLNRRIVANSYNLRKKGMSHEEAKNETIKRIKEYSNLKYLLPHELSNDHCFFIGFFLADGSVFKNKTNQGEYYSLSQSFKNFKVIYKIKSILNKLGYNYNESIKEPDKKSIYKSITLTISKGTGFGQQSKKGLFEIIPYLDKNGSKLLKHFNKEQILSFIDGFWHGDGNHKLLEKIPETKELFNSNLNLLSIIQEMCILHGLSANISKIYEKKKCFHNQMYKICIKKSNKLHIGAGKQKIIKDKSKIGEKVWCVEVDSNNIITRRNGKVCIMGNSVGFDYPEIDHIIDAKPKGNLGKIYQALGRCVRIHPNKEKAIVTDFTGNINRYGQIEDIHFKKLMDKWQVYGSDSRLLSDIAIKHIRPWKCEDWNVYINFGKYLGKKVTDLPDKVLIDMFKNTMWDSSNMHIREAILEIKKQRSK